MAKAREIPDCGDASAEEGARVALLTRADEMFSFREAALDWSDPEGVHDMRVASRRLRSALKDFRPYLPKQQLRPLRKQIKHLADALGEVRDCDVALALLERSAEEAPAEIAAGLEHLADERRERRKKARARLIEALSEDELKILHDELKVALALRPEASFAGSVEPAAAGAGQSDGDESRPVEREDEQVGDESQTEQSPLSFREAGREIIWNRLTELSELSGALFRPSAVEPLHDLRIAAKKLRYALELFSPCWGGVLKPFAKEIAELQGSLGEIHDCDMWIEDLGRRLSKRRDGESEDGQPTALREPSAERRAAMWLLRRFAGRRARSYEDALARWHAWENFCVLTRLSERVGPPAESEREAAAVSPSVHS